MKAQFCPGGIHLSTRSAFGAQMDTTQTHICFIFGIWARFEIRYTYLIISEDNRIRVESYHNLYKYNSTHHIWHTNSKVVNKYGKNGKHRKTFSECIDWLNL